MTVPPIQGFVFGLVQGLTEFLPISSSAHLVLLPWFLGWQDPGLSFDVALHAGTLVAVLWYFWKDWWSLARGTLESLGRGHLADNREALIVWKIAAASLPAVIAGLLLSEVAGSAMRLPLLVAAMLALFALALLWSDRRPQLRGGLGAVGWGDAICIGLAQAVAIMPGVSRSGVTITAARFLGLDRETSARFSFLLSTPGIAGAVVLEGAGLVDAARDPGQMIGLASSAVSGFLAVAALIRYLRRRGCEPFVVYRLLLATVIVAVWTAR
jgi:undecaprenyl-diphosphatase